MDTPADNPFPLRVRIVQWIFLAVGVAATLGLAYWQWTAWQSARGSFQNLGYAIQWPIFGAFLVVAYRKYIRYERERLLGDDEAAVPVERRSAMTAIPDDFLADASSATPDQSVDATLSWDDDRRRRTRSRRVAADDGAAPARPSDSPESPKEKNS